MVYVTIVYLFQNMAHIRKWSVQLLSLGRRLSSHNILRRESLHTVQQGDRGLLRVCGNEASSFLQGLITNDMQHLDGGYAMVLNSQGRVMHDVIIYKKGQHEYLIETNNASTDRLARHLKMYKLRKKIDVDNVSDQFKCYVLLDNFSYSDEDVDKSNMDCSYSSPKSSLELKLASNIPDGILCQDPRNQLLGHKLILPSNTDITSLISGSKGADPEDYILLRYKLGIAEGPSELPSGDITPLEANADYMHGVSFSKGCYIGQELTARVHHTGVVRKRYMPIHLSEPPSVPLPPETNIINSKGRAMGRLRAHAGGHGIALLRIAQCLADPDGLTISGIKVTTFKPNWWPDESTSST